MPFRVRIPDEDDYDVLDATELADALRHVPDPVGKYEVRKLRDTPMWLTQAGSKRKSGCSLCRAVLRVAKSRNFRRVILRFPSASCVPDAVAVVRDDEDLTNLRKVVDVYERGK